MRCRWQNIRIFIIISDLKTKTVSLLFVVEITSNWYLWRAHTFTIILLCTYIHKSWKRSSDKNTKNNVYRTIQFTFLFFSIVVIIIFLPVGSAIIVIILKHKHTQTQIYFYAIRFRSVTSRVCNNEPAA